MSHSFIAPSFAPVWVHCPGAPMMALLNPEPESQDTRDGTAAHWVGATVLEAFRDQNASLKLGMDLIGKTDPDGTLITQEIYDSARVYVDDVLAHCTQYGGMDTLMIEKPVHATGIHEQVFGTLDCAWFSREHLHLVIWDFKHGHKFVDPVWNWQELVYLRGLMDEFKINGIEDQNLTVEFRIAEPRCFTAGDPIQTFAFTASDARGYFNQLRAAAEAAMSGEGQVVPGAHCKYCPARHACPATRKETMFALDYVGSPIPDNLTVEGLSFEVALLRRMQTIMDARLEALEAEMENRIKRGEFIPGFVLDRSLGHRKFTAPDADVIHLGRTLGVDFSQSEKAVKPAEAERRCKAKGIDPDAVLAPYVERPVIGNKLVSASDSKAVRVFARTK